MVLEFHAPWGQAVHGIDSVMTVDELLDLPDDGFMYELVDGRLIRMPPGGFGNAERAMIFGAALLTHVRTHRLGRVTGPDGTYLLSRAGSPDTALAPDVAFVRADRVPPAETVDLEKALPLAPDLVVEIASPSQHRPELARKAQRYLDAGVQMVWVMWPRWRQVDVWRQGATAPVTTLGMDDTLDGADVVPGFTFPVASLFD